MVKIRETGKNNDELIQSKQFPVRKYLRLGQKGDRQGSSRVQVKSNKLTTCYQPALGVAIFQP
jgi:hypothetical protein